VKFFLAFLTWRVLIICYLNFIEHKANTATAHVPNIAPDCFQLCTSALSTEVCKSSTIRLKHLAIPVHAFSASFNPTHFHYKLRSARENEINLSNGYFK
jgi:hypothetical protein